MKNHYEKLAALLKLSHELANPLQPLAILGEGNTPARLSEKTFIVKASGSCLGTLTEEDVVECRSEILLSLLEKHGLPDAEVDGQLMASRVDASAKKPSVEALFHAWFLTLPDINFVGHIRRDLGTVKLQLQTAIKNHPLVFSFFVVST